MRKIVICLGLGVLASGAAVAETGGFVDPGAPEVARRDAGYVAELPEADPRLAVHAAPKALADGAMVVDWPRFLGPSDNCETADGPLLRDWGESGPALIWELEKGEGYASPAIVDGHLVLFSRIDGDETIESRDPETGELQWMHRYPVAYRDRYGYSNGPRGSAVIAGDRVYTFGVTAWLKCLALETGQLLWERDLGSEFKVRSAFFGSGSSPVVHDGRVILNLGGEDGPCVAAFDAETGAMLWGAEREWGASYSSPIVAELAGSDRVLVFAGGESDPPSGGLLTLDPESGAILDRVPWRADKFESVNASSPVAWGDRVFISECYGGGGVALQFAADGSSEVAWEAPDVGNHWMTPVRDGDGFIYHIEGRHPHDAEIVCIAEEDGVEQWRTMIGWQADVAGRPYNFGVQRGCILKADGGFLCLGEMGTLMWLELTKEGVEVLHQHQLFMGRETWSLPVVHGGLLYIMQHQPDPLSGESARMRVYDLRG